jgi:hypothetical protein
MEHEFPQYFIYICQFLDILVFHADRHLLVANNHKDDRRCAQRVVAGRHPMENVGLDGMIILQWIFNECDGEAHTGFIRLRIRPVAGTFEFGNEHSGSTKCLEFLNSLRTG